MKKNEVLAKNISGLREKFNLTQEELAEYLGVGRVTISHYESGRTNIPIAHLDKLADLFCIELYDLMENSEVMHQMNLAFAFRANTITGNDLKRIGEFKKIIKNYQRILTLEKRENERQDN